MPANVTHRYRSSALRFLLGVVLVVVLATPELVSGARLPNPDYVGKGRFDRQMKIEFRIYKKGGRHLVNFQAKNVKFVCDDGTIQRLTSTIIRTRMDEDGQGFERVQRAYRETSTTPRHYCCRRMFLAPSTPKRLGKAFALGRRPPAPREGLCARPSARDLGLPHGLT